MKNILCYGDSNTWGLNPAGMMDGKMRHDWSVRWTGRLQAALGHEYRIIDEGLNGRTTVFDDPPFPGRNGLHFLQVCIESHMPLDLLIIILGTNDTKPLFNASEVDITNGMALLLKTAKNLFNNGPNKLPEILIGAPVPLGEGILHRAEIGLVDGTSVAKSRKLAAHYKNLAAMQQCHFIDLGQYAVPSTIDNVHLDAEAHARVAEAMQKKIMEIFG